MKRKFAILLATTLALNSLPAPVFASDDFDIPAAAVEEDADLYGLDIVDDFGGVAEAVEPEVVEDAEAAAEETEEVNGLAEATTNYAIQNAASIKVPDQTWTGEKPDLSNVDALATITVSGGAVQDLVLVRGVDYTVESTEYKVGTSEVKFTGIGNYVNDTITAEPAITFTIVDPEVTDATYTVNVDESNIVYNGSNLSQYLRYPEIIDRFITIIKNGNEKLSYANQDYGLAVNLTYDNGENGANAGSVYELVFTIGEWSEKKSVTIAKLDLTDIPLNSVNWYRTTYNGQEQKPTAQDLGDLQVGDWNAPNFVLKPTDYTVTGWKNNVNVPVNWQYAPTAVITANADCVNYTGSGEVEFEIESYDDEIVSTLNKAGTAVYTGSQLEPSVEVTAYFGANGVGTAVIPAADYEIEYDESINVGTYGVWIVPAQDNYNLDSDASVNNAYTITPANMTALTITKLQDVPALTSNETLQNALGEYFSFKLGENEIDPAAFELSFASNKNDVGDSQTITFKPGANGNFTGQTTTSFTYVSAPFGKAYTSRLTATYTGNEIRPTATDLAETEGVVLKDSTETGVAPALSSSDFTVTDVSNAVNAGTATASIAGKGGYQGQKSTVEFTIEPASISALRLKVTGIADGSYFAGQEITGATVAIVDSSDNVLKTLTAADCKVTAKTIDSLTLKEVTVKGIGNYKDETTVALDESVKSTAVDLTNAAITAHVPAGLADYSVGSIGSFVTVMINGSVVDPDKYTLAYDGAAAPSAQNVKVGDRLELKITAKDPLIGLQKFTATVEQCNLADLFGENAGKILLAGSENYEVTYTGKEQKPVVMAEVPQNVMPISEGTDYTVAYADNTDAGEATVTLTGKGKYTGTATAKFTINKLNVENVTLVMPDVSDRQWAVGPTKDLSSTLQLIVNGTDELPFVNGTDYTVSLVEPKEIKKNNTDRLPEIKYAVTIRKDSKNYAGENFTATVAYPLAAKTVTAPEITIDKNTYQYDDEIDTDELGETVVVDGETLRRYYDYDLSLEKFNKDGTVDEQWGRNGYGYVDDLEARYNVVVTFHGLYVGTARKALAVGASAEFDIKDVKIVLPTTSQLVYDGTAKTVISNYIGALPINNREGSYYYKDNFFTTKITNQDGEETEPINVGTYKVTVIANANYGGATGESAEFTITPAKLLKDEFEAEAAKLGLCGNDYDDSVEYRGEETEKPEIYLATDTDLRAGLYISDFEVVEWDKTWDESQAEPVGKAKIALKAGANYTYDGTYDKATFTWAKGYLGYEDVSRFFTIDNVIYNGQAQHPQPKAVEGSDVPAEWITKVEYKGDVTNAYSNNAYAMITITVPESAKKYRAGTYTFGALPFVIEPVSVADATVAAVKNQTYTGKAIKPALDVTDASGAHLVEGTNYKVVYSNNTKVGTATVKITGIHNYAGEQTVNFKIVKAANKITKVTPVKKTLKVAALKKKAQTFTLKATAKTKGTITFKKTSGNKKITVNKAGKVTVKKGLKKGTYTIKVKATVAATATTKAASATKAIKITVK